MFEHWKQDDLITLALMALIGVIFVIYVCTLVSDFTIPEMSLSTSASSSRIVSVSQVSQYHIFGVYNDNLANLPETQLQLTLEGVMFSLNKGQSFAIMSSPDAPAKVYKIGDTLPGDATLEKVFKDEVIINYQGVMQSLKLPIDKLSQ